MFKIGQKVKYDKKGHTVMYGRIAGSMIGSTNLFLIDCYGTNNFNNGKGYLDYWEFKYIREIWEEDINFLVLI